MNETNNQNNATSITDVIASSGSFDIELIKKLGTDDYKSLMDISESLAAAYGKKYILTKNTINRYFNRSGSLPIIARFQNKIIGYIIGMPLELLSQEPWARLDKNYGKFNTLYTYAFVIENNFKKKGYAKILKKVYISWAKKKDGILYNTGHVKSGISEKFKGQVKIIEKVNNWQGTGEVFEYYRRDLDPEKIYSKKIN
jgi:hypothetical protein|tara:strand:+ start:7797 stop:8393 length:597 start_codon:yes stop_codon:yes gene_type:complete